MRNQGSQQCTLKGEVTGSNLGAPLRELLKGVVVLPLLGGLCPISAILLSRK